MDFKFFCFVALVRVPDLAHIRKSYPPPKAANAREIMGKKSKEYKRFTQYNGYYFTVNFVKLVRELYISTGSV